MQSGPPSHNSEISIYIQKPSFPMSNYFFFILPKSTHQNSLHFNSPTPINVIKNLYRFPSQTITNLSIKAVFKTPTSPQFNSLPPRKTPSQHPNHKTSPEKNSIKLLNNKKYSSTLTPSINPSPNPNTNLPHFTFKNLKTHPCLIQNSSAPH